MNIDYELWADYKTDILSKGFPYNHQTLRNLSGVLVGYTIFVIDRSINWQCMISTPEDITDFETNYKSNSNRNTVYSNDGTPRSLSTTANTPDGASWVQQTASAGWDARDQPASVVMPDGSIILTGGNTTTGYRNDVWKSVDNGVTWTQLVANAPWSARCGHGCVAAWDGSIILMGGFDQVVGNLNDVWRSTNQGLTWTQMVVNAGWEGRYYFSCVPMPDGSIVILGGSGVSTMLANDVWRSTDKGSTWTQMTAAAEWSEREFLSSVSLLDGSIVMMGGSDIYGTMMNDVWRSTDKGATWTRLTDNAWWSPRYAHTSVATPDGTIVMMGGWDTNGLKNDVWKSPDGGSTWMQLTTNGGWAARCSHTSVILPDGSIVLMGGNDPLKNDVWRSTNTQVVMISGQVVQISGQCVFTSMSGVSVTASVSGQPVSISGQSVSVSGNVITIANSIEFATSSGYCATSASTVSTTYTGTRPFIYDGAVVKSTIAIWSGNLVLAHTGVVTIAGASTTLSSIFANQTVSSTTTFVSGYPFIFASGDAHTIKFGNASGGYTTSGRTLSLRATYKVI